MHRTPTLSARRHAVLLLLLVAAGTLLGGCEIADPELPSYQTRLAVPLGEERLDIIDAIDDEDYLTALDDGTLGFFIDGDPDTVSLDFELAADIDPVNVSGDLGTFDLALSAPADFAFVLTDLYPAAAALDGMTMPVPAFSFASESSGQDLADLESATLASGSLTVTVTNGLPVPVSADSGPDVLLLDLVDPSAGSVIVSLSFPPVPAGTQSQQTADMSGVVLPGAVAVRLGGGSPGSGGSPVTIDASAAISVAAVFSDLRVSAAEAMVDAQEFSTSFTTALPSDYGVVQAVISDGSVALTVTNEMAIPCEATVTWDEIVDLDDHPLQLVVALPGGGGETSSADYGGHIVRAPMGAELSQLTATVSVTSPGSGGQPVLLQSDQGVAADLSAGRIEFSSVTGTVPELSYDFDSMNEEIDLPDELDGLQLCRATLVLELTNSAGVSAVADFDLVGINDSGEQRSLQVQRQIDPGEDGRAVVTRIVLDQDNSTVVDFLNNLPTHITLEGSVNLGGDAQIGTVRGGDFAVVDWSITSPVEVVVDQSHLYGDPEDLDLDEDTRDLIEDHAGAAEITLEVLNHLPVGIEARLLFSPDTLSIKTDPRLAIGPVAVDAAATDPVTHEVAAPRISRPTISLTADDTQVLAIEGLYSLIEVTLPSTDGEPVRVLTTDYVSIQGLISLDVEVHDEDDD